MEEKKYAETRLGLFGGLSPMIVMVASIILMSAFGLNGVSYLSAAGFLALVAGWLVYKDSRIFQTAVTKGLASPTLCGIIPILLLSFILGKVLSASQLGSALLYWFTRFNIPIGLLPLMCFALAALISIASGSSSAAILSLMFVLAPLAYNIGFYPGLCSAAIISGAIVGDNLAPVSDSMVISALSQEVPIPKVFRYRIKFSVVGFLISAVLYVIVGFAMAPAGSSVFGNVDSTYASSIIFLVVPIVMLGIMLKTSNIYSSMLVSEILGIIMMLIMGLMKPQDLFSTDGVIISGLTSNLEIILFMMLLFIMVSLISEAGCLDRIKHFLLKSAGGSVRKVEIICGFMAMFSASVMGSTPATLSFSGTISRAITKPTKVSRARIASITGGIAQGSIYVFPWAANAISVTSYVIAAGAAPEGFSPLGIIPFNFFCISLIVIYWIAILTGIGMKYDTDEELEADGVSLENN